MIVSFQHRFVFVAIPKTATHAVRTALRPHLGSRDWEQCVLFETKLFPVEALAAAGHGHLTCRQVQPFLPGVFDRCFKFCTVRNPYDRFMSYCHFVNRENQRMRRAPLETMKRIICDEETRRHILFRPQSEFVVDEDGQLLIDYVCRFEALQMHFDRVCERLRLPPSTLPQINVTSQVSERPWIDRELQEMVHEVYRQDFALFGYDHDLPTNLRAESRATRLAAF
jgi:hypothetical protein